MRLMIKLASKERSLTSSTGGRQVVGNRGKPLRQGKNGKLIKTKVRLPAKIQQATEPWRDISNDQVKPSSKAET